jgi:hypothetical protein
LIFVEHLTLMAAAIAACALPLGALAERLRRAGVSTGMFLAGTLALSMVAQLCLLLGVPLSSHLMFAVIAAAGATPVLSFAIFASQAAPMLPWASSTSAQRSPSSVSPGSSSPSGRLTADTIPVVAHQATMATDLGLQLIAAGFFLTPMRRRKPAPMAHAVTRSLGGSPSRIVQPVYST